MYSRFFNSLFIILLLLGSTAGYAQPTHSSHVIIAPNCLMKSFSENYQTLATDNTISLITIDHIKFLTAVNINLQKDCGGYMDVTQSWQEFNIKNADLENNAKQFLAHYTANKKTFSSKVNKTHYKISHSKKVKILFKQLNPQLMWNNLEILSTKFPNRSSVSDNGVRAADWLKLQIETMVRESGRTDVSIETITTGQVRNWYDEFVDSRQSSLVVKIGNSSEPGIVIGAHFDSVDAMPLALVMQVCSQYQMCTPDIIDQLTSDKPGADDDGSGTVAVLEIARTLINSGMNFKKPIYLIWYAAEEDGLVGSQRVVESFQNRSIPIAAVMQLDMVGFAYQNDPTIWLLSDNVDTDLTAYLATLITKYIKQPVSYTACGYGCSDHASWQQQGIPAAAPIESEMKVLHDNMNRHTKMDTMARLSLSHMTDYTKLAIAFAVEMAEPVTP